MSASFNPRENLLFLTNRVARQLSALALEKLETDEWRPQGTHMGILADLVNTDGVPQQELAISAIKDKATIARGIRSLEEQGFVRRETDPEDRRQNRIFLTRSGKAFFDGAVPEIHGVMERVTRDVDPAELEQCVAVLWRIYDTLQSGATTAEAKTNHLQPASITSSSEKVGS